MAKKTLFLRNLETLLAMRELSKRQFAKDIGVAPPSVVAWWTKGAEPRLSTLAAIGKAYNVSLDWLVRGVGSQRVS